jgi:hypothetical protein
MPVLVADTLDHRRSLLQLRCSLSREQPQGAIDLVIARGWLACSFGTGRVADEPSK